MDFHINHGDIDSTIGVFRKGIEGLDDVTQNLRNNIEAFKGGGFQGQAADQFIELMERKIALVTDLSAVYQQAISKLQQAQSKAKDSDQKLHKQISSG